MAKPRTRLTRLKHMGTIMRHPQQYYRYKTHKAAFIRENHLDMHHHYAVEHAAPHPYPGAGGVAPPFVDARQHGVIYPPAGGVPATAVAPGADLMAAAPHDHQAAAGVPAGQLGHYRQSLVTLRREAPGAAPVLRTAVKRDVHGSVAHPGIGRTQHSTLAGGHAVAAAALRVDAVAAVPAGAAAVPAHIKMSSGHYRPDHLAAVKLAIAGKMSGSLDRRQTGFTARPAPGAAYAPVNLTLKERMRAVSNWARH